MQKRNPAFPHEAELRDHIAQNLEMIEPGLQIHTGRTSTIEFSCEREGRIDILATDAQGGFLVIECKNGTALPDALGQLLGYLAWFGHWFPSFQGQVRGAIVATEISPRLLRAIGLVPNVPIMLFEVPEPSVLRRVI